MDAQMLTTPTVQAAVQPALASTSLATRPMARPSARPSARRSTRTHQIAFRYRAADSASGVTRDTAKRLAERLGVDETQAIHHALRALAIKLLPQYEADDGPLSAAQFDQIKQAVPQTSKRSVRSSLFATESA